MYVRRIFRIQPFGFAIFYFRKAGPKIERQVRLQEENFTWRILIAFLLTTGISREFFNPWKAPSLCSPLTSSNTIPTLLRQQHFLWKAKWKLGNAHTSAVFKQQPHYTARDLDCWCPWLPTLTWCLTFNAVTIWLQSPKCKRPQGM